MSLEGVLVDRARLLRQAASTVRVAGRTTFVDTEPGTWFACRLQLPTVTPEQLAPGSPGPRRAVFVPTLYYDVEDDNGDAVVVKNTDMLEVESDDLGSDVWQVTAAAMPLRKKEGVIGFTVTLKRVEQDEFVPKAV